MLSVQIAFFPHPFTFNYYVHLNQKQIIFYRQQTVGPPFSIHPDILCLLNEVFSPLTFFFFGEVKKRVEFNDPLKGEASYSMCSLELFKYSFFYKKCHKNKPHLKRVLSRETARHVHAKQAHGRHLYTSAVQFGG